MDNERRKPKILVKVPGSITEMRPIEACIILFYFFFNMCVHLFVSYSFLHISPYSLCHMIAIGS